MPSQTPRAPKTPVSPESLKRTIMALVAALLALVLYTIYITGRTVASNSSDSAAERSGLSVRTDTATGCEYLEGPRGGIIIRSTPTGQHSGCSHR